MKTCLRRNRFTIIAACLVPSIAIDVRDQDNRMFNLKRLRNWRKGINSIGRFSQILFRRAVRTVMEDHRAKVQWWSL
ncbi:hypothetical protein B0H14DRAFT_2832000, partial [Mycena olivaceomarginata]